ncbi:MAG: solute carrier family 23 protein [Methanocorpusculum sp.]|nr:solute carrier family 23 protein [Methanocorpusculum sp.]
MSGENTPVYNTDDPIPAGTLVLTILQHLFATVVYMTYPVIITSAINGSAELTTALISATLIGCGIASILQAARRLGTGYPIPIIPNSSYLPASLLAATAGGLPLLYGMFIFAGAMEILISRLTRFFRIIFPNEVIGVVLFLLGIAIVPFAFPLFFGSADGSPLDPRSTLVGVITLVTIIGLSLIPKRIFKFYSTIIGIIAGLLAAVVFGVFSPAVLLEITGQPLFAVPEFAFLTGYQFNPALCLPFLIAVICIVMKTVGNISLMSAYTGKGDKNTLRRGLFAEGAGLALTGALGGMGVGTSSSSTGLIVSTGIASRKVGFGIGILFILCGFLPAVGWVFHILPKPILGAVLIYAIVFVMINGIQDISSRMLDTRRSFVVILPILIGVSSAVCPYLYAGLPEWLSLLFTSPLTAGSLAVVLLGVLFRIGIPRTRTLRPSAPEDVHAFVEECGRLWTLNKNQAASISRELEKQFMAVTEGSLTLTISRNREILHAKISPDGAEDTVIPYYLL